MPPQSHPSPWTPLRILGPLLIVLGAITAPVSIALMSAHDVLSDEEHFIAAFGPLATDPEVQEDVEERVVSDLKVSDIVAEILPTDLPDWLSGSAEILKYLGIPTSVVDPSEIEEGSRASLDELEAIATDAIESAIRAGLEKALASDEAVTVWREALRESHPQVLSRLRSTEVLPDGSPQALLVDVQPIVAAAREALIEDGAAFAEYIPDLPEDEYRIALLTSEQMETVGATAAFILRFGEWAPWVSAGLAAMGVLLARHRSTWLLVGGALGAVAAFGARSSITSGAASNWITSAVSTDPIGGATLRAFLDASLLPTAPALAWIGVGGAVLAVVAGAVTLLRHR